MFLQARINRMDREIARLTMEIRTIQMIWEGGGSLTGYFVNHLTLKKGRLAALEKKRDQLWVKERRRRRTDWPSVGFAIFFVTLAINGIIGLSVLTYNMVRDVL